MKAILEILEQGVSVSQASKALILLHGRGGTAQNILKITQQLCSTDFYIAVPQAFNNVWYPYQFMDEKQENEPFLSQSILEIKDLIDQIALHVPKKSIFIAGFSQGACLTLEISTRFATQYGGIIAFTGGLIGQTLDESQYQGDFQGTKVMISNGDNDPYIPLIRSKQSKELMEKRGAHVTLKVYKGRPHLISEEEVRFAKENILFSN